MTKELHKAIMKRSKLRNKFRKTKSVEDRENYNKQRSLCKKKLRSTKKNYFNNLDMKKINDNRSFWKTVVPLFSKKTSKSDKIILTEKGLNISDDDELCRIFKEFFENIISELKIPDLVKDLGCNSQLTVNSSVDNIVKTFENHPSIVSIKKNFTPTEFNFRKVNQKEVEKVINDLSVEKAIQSNDIPTKIIKLNKDIFGNFIKSDFNNNCVENEIFSEDLKHADVIPAHKKNDKCDKSNYRPVSILPNISKIYERLIYNQLYEYFDKILSPFQCGFRKGYGTQHCLLIMIEKFKESIDKGDEFGALLTDLSKAFDCIDHSLLIAKLHCYGLSSSSLNLISSYLLQRTQRIKINNSYSEKTLIKYGVPQGSILGPLLFNIGLIDLFFECDDTEIASYADDTTPYSCEKDILSVLRKLTLAANKLFSWFEYNHMKANPGKCHILLSKKDPAEILIAGTNIENSSYEKLLGVHIDSDLKFDKHVSEICDKVSQKVNALSRISNYMSLSKRRIVMKTFIESQFNYCPLIWMLHSRMMNNRINRIHERALRIVYSDYKSTFNELLSKDGSFSIHHRNIQSLAIEIFKFLHGLSPSIMSQVFKLSNPLPYHLRNSNELYSRNPRTVRYGTETISFLAPKIWAIVPSDIKNSRSLTSFKTNIRKWKPDCPCRLCKRYLQHVGFI